MVWVGGLVFGLLLPLFELDRPDHGLGRWVCSWSHSNPNLLPLVELGWSDHGLGLDPGVKGADPLQDPLGLHFHLPRGERIRGWP